MSLHFRRRMLACAGAALAPAFAVAPSVAHAAYPDHPITLVVPFTPAGPTDILARLVAQHLGAALGQTVVVENRPGASGGVGMQHVARSAPDGYTLVMGGLPGQVLNPALSSKLPYDPDRDFEPVICLVTVQYILVARPDLPANNVPELVKLLKANPGKFHYGTPGVGNTSHIAAEMFKSAAGVDIGHVPYQGDSPAITALMGGVVDLVFTLPLGVQSAIQAGKLKPIATAAPQRSPVLPNLPTFGEQGLPGMEAQTWFSILAPAGTPAPIVDKLNVSINKVLQEPEVRKRLGELGALPAGGSVEDFKRFLATEKPKWTKIVKDSGATVD